MNGGFTLHTTMAGYQADPALFKEYDNEITPTKFLSNIPVIPTYAAS